LTAQCRYFTLLTVVTLLVAASCSRRALPGESDHVSAGRSSSGVVIKTPEITLRIPDVTMSSAEEKRLEKFMEAGVQQPVAAGAVTAEAIIETARGYLGVPHCMGGTTARCMDCSGLVFRVFSTNGITLPHSSEEQARYGRIISEKEMLMPGDLLFFIRTYNTSRLITHTGIYIGEGTFIHTSSSRGVIITSMDDPYWSGRYIFGTRILE
jgi:murein DD-endopeptidase / murein LD-carboxypeptidase